MTIQDTEAKILSGNSALVEEYMLKHEYMLSMPKGSQLLPQDETIGAHNTKERPRSVWL